MTYSFIGLADTIPRLPNPTILSTGTKPGNHKAIKDNNKYINHKMSRLKRADINKHQYVKCIRKDN